LVAAGKRFRGTVCDEVEHYHAGGLGPAGPLVGDSQGSGWGGHRWSAWVSLRSPDLPSRIGVGVYANREQAERERGPESPVVEAEVGAHADGEEIGPTATFTPRRATARSRTRRPRRRNGRTCRTPATRTSASSCVAFGWSEESPR